MKIERQTTLKNRVLLSGTGVHSNCAATIIFNPAEADTGIRFRRGSAGAVAAHWSQVRRTELCTAIGSGRAAIATIEHLMAALYGLGIDNALIEIDGPEVPAMDGSAAAFVALIDAAGIERLTAPRRYLKILKPLRLEIDGAYGELRPHDSGFRLEATIDSASSVIGRQARAFALSPENFRRDLAPARSFGLLADAERLWRAGLALGASLENTLVVDAGRLLNPTGLRYPDEFVRHKLLDAVGDLALAGRRILGQFRSNRGGHKLNLALLRALFADRTAFALVDEVPPVSQMQHPLPMSSAAGAEAEREHDAART